MLLFLVPEEIPKPRRFGKRGSAVVWPGPYQRRGRRQNGGGQDPPAVVTTSGAISLPKPAEKGIALGFAHRACCDRLEGRKGSNGTVPCHAV